MSDKFCNFPKNKWAGNSSSSATGNAYKFVSYKLRFHGSVLGHPKRRVHCGEFSEIVRDKVAYAFSQGLKVIACVGETLEQREAGSTMEVFAAQTKAIAVTYHSP